MRAGQPFGAGADHGRRAQRGDGDVGMAPAPLGEEPLHLGGLHRGREVGVGTQRGVLGERDRVVGPRAVDGGAGDAHDPAGADRRGGVEHVTRALDVDPRHERDVGHGVDDAGEVHDDVDALEQRLQLGAGDVDPGEFDRARAPFGLAHVEAEDRDRRRDGRRGRGGDGGPRVRRRR